MPEAILPRARSTLGLGGWVVCHARPDAMLGLVVVSRRVSPGRLTKYAWDRHPVRVLLGPGYNELSSGPIRKGSSPLPEGRPFFSYLVLLEQHIFFKFLET